ncbi:MAG: hypothetical protein HFG60_08335 [Lachnospiraceae bacterium]|nr:hypothetical protein [Lachnospiraceae bacterium]
MGIPKCKKIGTMQGNPLGEYPGQVYHYGEKHASNEERRCFYALYRDNLAAAV